MKNSVFDFNGNIVLPSALKSFGRNCGNAAEKLNDMFSPALANDSAQRAIVIERNEMRRAIAEQQQLSGTPEDRWSQGTSPREEKLEEDWQNSVDILGVYIEKTSFMPFQNDLELALNDWELFGPHNQVFPKAVDLIEECEKIKEE